MNKIQSVGIVGAGNVAHHLANAFDSAGLNINFIASRNSESGKKLANIYSTEYLALNTEFPPTDLICICITDDSIKNVSDSFQTNSLVVHTSGSIPMNVLKNHDRHGIFYPLQTFTKDKNVYWKEVPLLIESANSSDHELLLDLAKKISNRVDSVSSDQREKLHLAAVFSCNFTNHLWAFAQEYCDRYNVDFNLLLPLIQESSSKLLTNRAENIQTGPAIRKDIETISKHLHMLKKDPDYKKLYNLISQLIQDKHT